MNRRLVLVAAAIVCGWIWTAWSQTTPPKKDKAPEVNLPPPAQFSRYAAEGRVGRPPPIVKQGGGAKDSRKGDDDDDDK
jgi:hypothetical protein